MKTLNLLASGLITFFLSSTALGAAAANTLDPPTKVVNVDFNKIIVTGNARVELVQSSKPRVVIYENYDKDKVSILQKADKLYIDSKEDLPITIVVYIKDVLRIDASQHSFVTTRGKFDSNILQVFLKDNARAYVNGDIRSLYTVIKDKSSLQLCGSSTDHTIAMSKIATLKMDRFAALKTTNKLMDGAPIASNFDAAILKDSVVAERIVR